MVGGRYRQTRRIFPVRSRRHVGLRVQRMGRFHEYQCRVGSQRVGRPKQKHGKHGSDHHRQLETDREGLDMNRTILPEPPNPNSAEFRSDFASWQRAVYRWMQQAKNRIETDSAANIQPMGPLAVSTYTAVATSTGTDATSN